VGRIGGGVLVGEFVTQLDVMKTRIMTHAASTAILYDLALDCITKKYLN
jgi:hypothetical protein